MAPLILLVAAAGALLVSAHLARLAKLSSRVGARHARAGVRVVGNPVWSDHSHPRSLMGPTLFSWARRNFSIVELYQYGSRYYFERTIFTADVDSFPHVFFTPRRVNFTTSPWFVNYFTDCEWKLVHRHYQEA